MDSLPPGQPPLAPPMRHPPLQSFGSRVAAICLVALLLRAAFIGYVPRQPDHVDDSYFYHGAGVSIAQGNGYRAPSTGALTAGWPPGYPFLLGGAYRAFTNSPWTAKWLNVILGVASVALLALAARRHFGPRAALLAAALLAAYPAHIYFTALVMTETLFAFLLTLAWYAVGGLAPSVRSAVVLGLLAGYATLVRGEALLLPLAYCAYWRAGQPSWRKPLILTAVAWLVLAAAVAPWTFRNYHVMGAFVPLNTYSSDALWAAHHEGAKGAFSYDFALAERYVKERPQQAELHFTAEERRIVLRFMRDHPIDELRLIPRKLLLLSQGDADVVSRWIQTTRGDGFLLSGIQLTWFRFVADFYYYALLSAAATGLWLAWRRDARPVAPLAFFAALLAVWLFMHGWLFFGESRYHLPLMPFLITLAAAGIDELWRAVALVRARAPG